MGETSDIGVLIELIRNARTIVEVCDASVAPLFSYPDQEVVREAVEKARPLADFLKDMPGSGYSGLNGLLERYNTLNAARAYIMDNRVFIHFAGNLVEGRISYKFEMLDQPKQPGKDTFLSPTDLVMKLVKQYPAFRADIAQAAKLFYDEEGKPIYYGSDGKAVTEVTQRIRSVNPFRYSVPVDQMTESQLRGMNVLETLDLVRKVDTTIVIKDRDGKTTGLKNSGLCFYESHGDGASGVFRLYLQHKQELRKTG